MFFKQLKNSLIKQKQKKIIFMHESFNTNALKILIITTIFMLEKNKVNFLLIKRFETQISLLFCHRLQNMKDVCAPSNNHSCLLPC